MKAICLLFAACPRRAVSAPRSIPWIPLDFQKIGAGTQLVCCIAVGRHRRRRPQIPDGFPQQRSWSEHPEGVNGANAGRLLLLAFNTSFDAATVVAQELRCTHENRDAGSRLLRRTEALSGGVFGRPARQPGRPW